MSVKRCSKSQFDTSHFLGICEAYFLSKYIPRGIPFLEALLTKGMLKGITGCLVLSFFWPISYAMYLEENVLKFNFSSKCFQTGFLWRMGNF